MLFKKIMSNLKPFFSGRYEGSTEGIFEGFLGCGLWVTLFGMRKNSRKMFSKKVRWAVEAYHCLLSKNTWFRFFQRSGAKICVKQQMSFWGGLEGWAKRDSWVILKKSQKRAPEELKQSESCI